MSRGNRSSGSWASGGAWAGVYLGCLWLAGCEGRHVLAVEDRMVPPLRCSPGVDVGCICSPISPATWVLGAELEQAPTEIAATDDGDVVELSEADGFMRVCRRGAGAELLWEQGWHTQARLSSLRLAVNPVGDAYVFGAIGGRWNFGAGFVGTDLQSEIFVLKLSGVDGSVLWSVSFPDSHGLPNDTEPWDLAVGPDGVFLVGDYRSFSAEGARPLNFGGEDLPQVFDSMFIVKLSAVDGAHLWSSGFLTNYAFPRPTVAYGSGRVYITGGMGGGEIVVNLPPYPDLGGGPLMGEGSSLFVAGYDASSGAHIFSSRHDSSSGQDIVADDSGFTVVVANSGELQIGELTVDTADYSLVVAHFDPEGRPLYLRPFGRSERLRVGGLALRADGGLYIRGVAHLIEATPALDLGGGPISFGSPPFASGIVHFVVRLDSAGGWLAEDVVTQEADGRFEFTGLAYSACSDVLYDFGKVGAEVGFHFGDRLEVGPGYYLRRLVL